MPKEKTNTAYFSELISNYQSKIKNDSKLVDIITFAEAGWGLKNAIDLLPMQRFLLKVFYGLPLDSDRRNIPIWDDTRSKLLATLTESECMDFMIEEKRTNLKSYTPGETRNELILVGGRRGSKSTITSLICSYELYRLETLENPQAYYGFPSGQDISITTIANTAKQSEALFKMIKAKALGCTYLKDKMKGMSENEISFETVDDRNNERPPSLSIICGSPASSTLRSGNNIIVIMDEVAFFPVVGKINGKDVYDAFTPSTQTFLPKGKDRGEGKIILLSSPYTKSGIFWDKYMESFSNPDSMLMFQFYSTLMNPNFDSLSLQTKKKADRVKFDCEYGAKFSDTVCSWIDYDTLHKAVTDERSFNLPEGKKGMNYFMGIDYGGKNDGSGIAICHKEEDSIVLDFAEVYYGKDSDVWENQTGAYENCTRLFGEQDIISPSMFVDEVVKLCKKFDVVEGWFDQFNGYGLMELFKEKGLHQFEMKSVTNTLNLTIYQTVKSLINVGKLKLFNHPVLIPELETLEERKDRNVAVVEAPQRRGFHDDISDAFSRAVYTAYNSKKGNLQIRTIGISGGRGFSPTNGNYRSFQFKKFKMHAGELYSNFRSGR